MVNLEGAELSEESLKSLKDATKNMEAFGYCALLYKESGEIESIPIDKIFELVENERANQNT